MMVMRRLGVALLTVAVLHGQTNDEGIDREITQGNFARAQRLINENLASQGLAPTSVNELSLQATLLDRIKLDFSKSESEVRQQLGPYYPDLSDEQMRRWETTNELEMRVIEGEKRYFRNAAWNLFRVNPEARARKAKVDGPAKDDLRAYLKGYLPPAMEALRKGDTKLGNSKKIEYTYSIEVKADAVPAGEMVRAWLPFPRSDRQRLHSVALEEVNGDNPIISPDAYEHKSVYLEKAAVAGVPTVFKIRVSYTACDEWNDIKGAAMEPYDRESDLYKEYTAERDKHIRFTPAIKELSSEIVQDEADPVEKAWRLFKWIGEHIPWSSALEYSTMSNIPEYCLTNRRGDCGMKGLLFITLCRYNGIPAKWQSGWMLYPGKVNLHDWTEVYFEGLGWVPVDPDFNLQDISEDAEARRFFFGGADAYRLIVNDDFGGRFFPAKIHHRSETVDFQRGEVEWRGGNLYFDQWRYKMQVSYGE